MRIRLGRDECKVCGEPLPPVTWTNLIRFWWTWTRRRRSSPVFADMWCPTCLLVGVLRFEALQASDDVGSE
jgi:hypothetical protein